MLHLAGDVELVLERHQPVATIECGTPLLDVLEGAVHGDPQVFEVHGLGDKVERAAVHRGADVLHVAVGGNDHGAEVWVDLGDLLQEGQAVHLGHVNVGEDHINGVVRRELLERFDSVAGEDKFVAARPDLTPHALQHQRFEIGLVVYDQDPVRHLPRPGPEVPLGDGAASP